MRRGPKSAKSKEAKPSVAGKSPKDDRARVRDLYKRLGEAQEQLRTRDRELAESQEQQTVTAEILRIISSSPANVQPVLVAVAENAARLCESFDSSIFSRDGDRLLLVAHHGPIPFGRIGEFAIPLTQGSLVGRSIIEHRAVQVPDVQTETEEFPLGAATARQFGHRTGLAVPLLRESAEIGAIAIRRTEVRPFTDQQIELLQTFADQAVIAIENVRLFNETKDALERQTATAEILNVISSSPTDAQPVFDATGRSASRLWGGEYAIVTRYDGELLQLAAHYNPRPGTAEEAARSYPRVVRQDASFAVRALVTGAVVHVADVDTEDLPPEVREFFGRIGLRAVVCVPMLHKDRPVGVVAVSRGSSGAFTSRQIELLKTFADQAVIAIENVRLFEELQTSNRDLTQALEQQTATSEILSVISTSPTDAQPVFDTIIQNAVRLLGGFSG